MSCKKLVIFFGLLLSFAFSSLLVSSSYAVDDIVLHVDQDTPNNTYSDLCSTVEVCSQYSYFIYKPIDISNFRDNSFITVLFRSPNIFRGAFSKGMSSSIYTFSSVNRISLENFTNLSGVSFSVDLILTNTPGDYLDYMGSSPTGNIDITSNGTFDVTQYASATVNVPQEISSTPYDDKLDQIIKAIYVCAGTMLVIYFFYCIYRMLIKRGGT